MHLSTSLVPPQVTIKYGISQLYIVIELYEAYQLYFDTLKAMFLMFHNPYNLISRMIYNQTIKIMEILYQ